MWTKPSTMIMSDPGLAEYSVRQGWQRWDHQPHSLLPFIIPPSWLELQAAVIVFLSVVVTNIVFGLLFIKSTNHWWGRLLRTEVQEAIVSMATSSLDAPRALCAKQLSKYNRMQTFYQVITYIDKSNKLFLNLTCSKERSYCYSCCCN